MNETTPNVWTKGYLPDGRQVSITATPGCDVHALVALALELSAALTAANITVREPGLEPGENKELIVTVMRREKPADGTPIIDFYPAWGDGGDEPFGTYKYLHIYLNKENPQLTADFLAASGFKSLEDIPLYDGQSPLKRTKNRAHPKETRVPTPFSVVKKQGDEKIGSDGQPYRPWEFVRYESTANPNGTRPSPPSPSPTTPPSTNGAHDEKPAAHDGKETPALLLLNDLIESPDLKKQFTQVNHRRALVNLLAKHGLFIDCETTPDMLAVVQMYTDARAKDTDHERTQEQAVEAVKAALKAKKAGTQDIMFPLPTDLSKIGF